MKRSPFEIAGALVEEWLDQGLGSPFAKRDARVRLVDGMAWDIDLRDDGSLVSGVRLVLPPDFPASPCELYVNRDRFLKIPHVEADGHVCLGLQSIPNDYIDPVSAVVRTLQGLKEQLLGPATDPRWVEHEFHSERSSYWTQLCVSRLRARDRRPVPKRTYVDVGELETWSAGTIAAYVPVGSKHAVFAAQVAAADGLEPHETATRHGWAEGTLVRGNALFVRLPSDMPWTPASWPTTFEHLDALIAHLTDREQSLVGWLQQIGRSGDARRPTRSGKKTPSKLGEATKSGNGPLLVVLVQDGAVFGYQVFPAALPVLQMPAMEPVTVKRVDPDWVLARDHHSDVVQRRRGKRVLLLGCGSLGSPLAAALARAGVGHLDMVDAQVMEPENTGRHELGLSAANEPKAPELASSMRKAFPGITVNGFLAEATTWTAKHCLPGRYDLVVDCTAESSVRTYLAHVRAGLLGDCPIVHAWSEPLCSAGHVVLSQPDVPWPEDDPADELINASDLSADETRIDIPACSGGFHAYGGADIESIAAFAAERIIAVLDHERHPSTVWSWVRSSAFFASLSMPVKTRSIVPTSSSAADSATTTRDLAEVLRNK